MDKVAVYVRRSTDKQTSKHQTSDIEEWLEGEGLQWSDVDLFTEQASGASSTRNEFNSLLDSIQEGSYQRVVVWEISRIARKGLQAQRFFDFCENNQVTINVVNGSIRTIEPDGHGRLIADIIAAVAAEERRSLIRRTKSGVKRAKNEGKWVGKPPAGFETVDGYLRPCMTPDYDAGDVGYHDVVDALEVIEAGVSYRQAALNTPNITRQTLSKIHQERKNWYIDSGGDPDDERIASAKNSLN